MTGPNKMWLSYYGDDFTGSTDCMEALAFNGVRTVLFLTVPSPELLRDKFPNIQAFGVAGVSRSLAPEEMDRELRDAFQLLKVHDTAIVHYKICSTFDSSPQLGSIGQAMDSASAIFPEQAYIPLLVGVPFLKRFTLFGNHFATVGDETFRLDRHPTMSRHPSTPMNEGDLRIHLSHQTAKSIDLMDMNHLEGSSEQVWNRLQNKLAHQPDILLFDVLDEARLKRSGEILWEEALNHRIRFVVGSSGIEYALAAYWHERNRMPLKGSLLQPQGPVDQLLVVSGSCSPVTEAQIHYALKHGFAGVAIETERFINQDEADIYCQELIEHITILLEDGKSPLLYTALGTGQQETNDFRNKLVQNGLKPSDSGWVIGNQLGRLTYELVVKKQLKRVLIAGGDTSGYVMKKLDIYALECLMALAPGAPLCRCYSENPRFNLLEIALKGGQMGKEDYFIQVLAGK